MNPPIRSTAARRLIALTAGILVCFTADSPAAELAPEDSVLARVGERTLTLEYFTDEWERMPPSERPQDDIQLTAYQKFLDDLVIRHLLALEALSHPKKLLPADQANLDGLREHMMLQELYRIDVVDPTEVEEEDISLYLKQLTSALEIRAFVFQDKDQAQLWYSKINRGTPVSELEAAVSETDSTELHIDEIGYVMRTHMSDALARVLYRLAPGRLSEPLPLEESWALYQVTDLRRIPAGFDTEDPEAVLEEARKLLIRETRESYRTQLADSLQITYHEEAMDTLVNRFLLLPPRVQSNEDGSPLFNINLPLPEISVEDSALVLAETKDQVIEARHVIRFLATTAPYARSEIRSRGELQAVVDRVAFDRALVDRAWKMGLDRHPNVVEAVQRRYEGFQVFMMYEDSVLARVHPPLDTLRAFFRADSTHFINPATADVWMCMTADERSADSLLALARSGADLEELARENSLHFETAQRGGMAGPQLKGHNPNVEVEEAIFTTPGGEFGGPVETANGWVIFKVLEKTAAAATTFEAALSHVNSDYRRIREEAEMQAFLDRIRERIPVEVHPERLEVLVENGP